MKIAVIGGGAAGMMAALTAAQQGAEVVLLERQPRVGRKLLATGNGRCNLTNRHTSAEHYHGAVPAFVRPALEAFGVEETLAFFAGLGLLTVTEEDGKVYPFSDQAGSVVDVLRFAAEAAGVTLCTDFSVEKIEPKAHGFLLQAGEKSFTADRVILCCGGLAGKQLGGSRSGYELLAALGHTVTPLAPALVQVRTDTTYVRSLKGVRADAAVRLCRGDTLLAESAGEVQFTEYGVSGPEIFAISRTAAAEEGAVLHLDLLRGYSAAETEALLAARRAALPQFTLENLLTGMLHNRLGRTLLRYAGYDLTAPISSLNMEDDRRIAAAIHDFALPVTGTMGFDGAQVTAGGASTAEFDPHTLQSRLVPGLYAAGEVLDIDGDCGGYNLQWAWSSGHLAGQTL